MALNIKRQETELQVRRLAFRLGTSVTEAVDRAVSESHAALDRDNNVDAEVQAAKAWLNTLPKLPVHPTHDEVMAEMYDENGLPR